jgi:hypothetical protein
MPTIVAHSTLLKSDKDAIKSAMKSDVKYLEHAGFTQNSAVDTFFSTGIKKGDPVIGLVYHNPEDGSIPFFPGVNLIDCKGVIEYFFQKCKSKGIKIVDLITCNVRNVQEQHELFSLATEYNLDIRYSIDQTSDTTNWVLESHNIDIKPIYFAKDLPLLSILGLSSFTDHFALSNNNTLLFQTNYGPSRVKNGRTIMQVSPQYKSYSGRGSSYFVVQEDGSLLKKGANSYGEVAVPGNQYVFEPQLDTTYSYEQVSAGWDGTIAMIDDNGVKKAVACGRNEYNSNGIGSFDRWLSTWSVCVDSSNNPITNVSQVVRGYRNSWILKDDGTVWGAGRGDFYLLTGNGTSHSEHFVQIQRKSGDTYSPLTGVSKLCANQGNHHGACAVMNSGSVLIWGKGGTGNTTSIETTPAECGTREISIPNENIIDMIPHSDDYSRHKFAYLKTQSNKWFTVGGDQIPVEDTAISPGSATIGGTGRYVTKIIRIRLGFMALIDNGDVYCRGKFVYGEAPYSNNTNSPWTKNTFIIDSVLDIDSYAYDVKFITTSGEVKFIGNNAVWDFNFNPMKWYELDYFNGQNIIQWASHQLFVAILNDLGEVHIRTYYTPVGPFEQYTEYYITNDVKQLVSAEDKGIIMLKKDGTVYYLGTNNISGSGASNYQLFQWGNSYKDTTTFVMVAASRDALYALDSNGNVYATGNPGNNIDINHTVGSEATIIRPFDEYKTTIESWAGSNNKVISIYAMDRSLYMGFGGGYMCPVGYSSRNRFGNGTGEWSPYYKPVLGPDNNPLPNIIALTGIQRNSNATLYTTSSGKVYFSGLISGYTINGTGNYQSPYRCIEATSLKGASNIIFGRHGDAVMYNLNGNTYVVGNLARIGAAQGTLVNGPTVSTQYLLSDSIGTDITIKDVNRNFVYNGSSIDDNITDILSSFSGNNLKHKIKELLLTNSSVFTNKSTVVNSAEVLDLFSGSFAIEMQSSTRKIRMKLKTSNKYVIDSGDITGLGNGDVLYIPDEGTTDGTPITITLAGVEYTYTLYNDKITYNTTDYVIDDTITFGSLNLVIKGLSSTEFIMEGSTSDPPCFGGNTYIKTPNGEVMIKDLKNGDIITTNEGPQQIVIHKSIIAKTTPSSAPYMIKKHAIKHNTPSRDTIISPTHMILLTNKRLSHPIHLSKHIDGIYQLAPGKKQVYYNIETSNFLTQVISANNLLAETYPGEQIPKTHQLLYISDKSHPSLLRKTIVSKKVLSHYLK